MADSLDSEINNLWDVGLSFLVYDLDKDGHLSEDFLNSPLGKYCAEELRKEKRYAKNK